VAGAAAALPLGAAAVACNYDAIVVFQSAQIDWATRLPYVLAVFARSAPSHMASGGRSRHANAQLLKLRCEPERGGDAEPAKAAAWQLFAGLDVAYSRRWCAPRLVVSAG
jgi:hypothetical protein